MAFPSHRDVTETTTGNRTGEFATAYAAGEKYAELARVLRVVKAPIAGGEELPAVTKADGTVAIITALLTSPLFPSLVKVQAPDSLVAYAQRFGTEQTVLFVEDVPTPRLTLVIDYHQESATRGAYDWSRHRAVYEPLLTPEWQTWTANSGKRAGQVAFAQFLEDNLPDIASPSGADVLEIARTLEVKKGVSFRSSVRLDNGETQLRYEEQIEGSAAKGQFAIPDRLTLGLQPYKGAAKYEVIGRFRYQLVESQLKLGIDLERTHKVLEQAVADTLADILAKLPDVPVFYGPAPAVPSSDPLVITR